MAGMRRSGYGRSRGRSKDAVKLVIGAHNTLIADAVNGFSIAFLKVEAHFQ
jgi:hypothetical protein